MVVNQEATKIKKCQNVTRKLPSNERATTIFVIYHNTNQVPVGSKIHYLYIMCFQVPT